MPITKKEGRGWQAEDVFEFAGRLKLSVQTYKIDGRMVSRAAVNFYGEQMVKHIFGLSSGGDYSKRVIVTPGVRASEKSVAEQHTRALALVPQLLTEAHAHYAKYPSREDR